MEYQQILLKNYPFCLMELVTTKVIFENFYRFPDLNDELIAVTECYNVNIYSGLLKSCSDVELDELYQWVDKIRENTTIEDPLTLEKQSPRIRLAGKSKTYELNFMVYVTKTNQPLFIMIQMVDPTIPINEDQYRLVKAQLDECYRGLRFGEAFYVYSITEISLLIDEVEKKVNAYDELILHKEKILAKLKIVEEISIWTQLHILTDLVQLISVFLKQIPSKQINEPYSIYLAYLETLTDLIDLGVAMVQFARHRKDIGNIRKRKNPFDLDEQKYKTLMSDFDILRKMIGETEFDGKDILELQANRCLRQLVILDNDILNHSFQRLRTISTDLSYEMEKIIQFNAKNPKLLIANHFSQHYLCKYLINTLRYLIIEHLEIPKERKLSNKSAVGKLELEVIDLGEEISFIFRDDGVQFEPEAILQRAVHRGIITQEIGDWMRKHDRSNIYNLMLRSNFGPPVKPPPLTRYRPYLSMINDEIQILQGKMTFYQDHLGWNVIKLVLLKKPFGISLEWPTLGNEKLN